MKWMPVTEEHYWEMLGMLPPACMTGNGFLLGEAYDHNAEGKPVFTAFVKAEAGYFKSLGHFTIAAFKAVNAKEIA